MTMTPTTPLQPELTSQALPMAQQIARAVAMGAVAMPNTSDGWQSLVDNFSSTGGPIPGSTPVQVTPTPATPATDPGQQQSSGAGMFSASASAPGNVKAFVSQMGGFAQQAQAATGINASVILAQWGNETGWGSSPAWRDKFNPAGIGITSDAVAGDSYGSPAGGVKAYIDFVNNNSRYEMVKKAGVNNPDAQAVAFGNSGWAAGQYNNGGGPGSSLIANLGMFTPTAGQTAAPSSHPGNPTAPVAGNQAVAWATGQIGTQYVWGGEDPSSPGHAGAFDCSGLVQAAYKAEGVNLPRVAQAQYDATTKLPAGAQLQAGDLVFFGSSTHGISHVGIYIGNGQMIDAPHTGAQVRTENYQWGDYVGATRPTDNTGQSMLQPAATPVTDPKPASVPTREMNLGQYYQALAQVSAAIAAHGGK